MGLYESVGDWVRETLPHDRSDPRVIAALAGKPPAELLVLYLNWQSRIISRRSRQVLRAAGFDDHPLILERGEAVGQIVRDIEEGRDLTRYLSRQVRLGFMLAPKPNKKQLNRLQHLDLLLNDWGVHHLHISTVMEGDGFVERGDALLFAVFRDDVAYLIAMGTHASFSDAEIAEIVIENWPEAEIFCELHGVLGSRDEGPSSEERGGLRKAGLMVPVQIGGRIYVSRNAMSTAGTSARVSMRASHILRVLGTFEKQMRADASNFVAMLREAGGEPSDIPEFKFVMFDHGFGVVETTSGLPVRLE